MSTQLVPLAPSLYELEHDLQDLVDTEGLVTPELEEEFKNELASAVQQSVAKRDRYGHLINHVCHQQEFCDQEIKRLEDLKRMFGSIEKRVRGYLAFAIESLGTDAKGRYKRLDGKTVSFSLASNPPSVDIQDEDAIPAEYKSITVTMPLTQWAELLQQAGFDLVQVTEKAKITTSRSAIRDAIDADQEVPGADLKIGGHRLVIK